MKLADFSCKFLSICKNVNNGQHGRNGLNGKMSKMAFTELVVKVTFEKREEPEKRSETDGIARSRTTRIIVLSNS